jgi:pimeloyl-ACP methyl ester carboxylesterase
MGDEFPHVDGVEHRHVDVRGVRVHLAEAGPADAPPILLLHGWPQHWYMWRRVIGDLRGDRRVIAPDLRGFGWSAAPGHGYDIETFAADQVALLNELGIERLPVAGHDWGGVVAFLLGLRHPERIERALMLNAPHLWARPNLRLLPELWRSWYTLAMAMPGLGPFMARNGIPTTVLSRGNAGDPFEPGELEIYVGRLRQPERALASSKLYRNYQRLLLAAARGTYRKLRLTVPTRIVFGAQDRYVSTRLLEGYEPYADDMEVELVPDSGHFIVNEKPELVIERARALLAGP